MVWADGCLNGLDVHDLGACVGVLACKLLRRTKGKKNKFFFYFVSIPSNDGDLRTIDSKRKEANFLDG